MRSGRSGLASTSAGLGRTGTQVRVQAEALAKAQEALLGARRIGIGGVPLRPADGAEQHGVRAPARLQHLVGEGGPVLVDRGPADRMLDELELPIASSSRRAAERISGPIPSPARTTILGDCSAAFMGGHHA